MGLILRKNDGFRVFLNAIHQFGRGDFNNTVMVFSDVSRRHADIFWTDRKWYLKDFSKNGTLLNGRKIFQTTVEIKKGALIQFSSDEESIWEFIDDDEPCSYLSSLDKTQFLQLSDYLAYPNDTTPQVSFFKIDNKKWHIDTGGEIRALISGEEYLLSDKPWVFHQNETLEETVEVDVTVGELLLEFSLSEDEEEVGLELKINDHRIDFGKKVYNHLLLVLAQEKQNGSEWVRMEDVVSRLKKELLNASIDEYYVNVQIHRLRKFLMKNKPLGPYVADLIVRKIGFLALKFNHILINKKAFV